MGGAGHYVPFWLAVQVSIVTRLRLLQQHRFEKLFFGQRRSHPSNESPHGEGEIRLVLLDQDVPDLRPAAHDVAPRREQETLTRLGMELASGEFPSHRFCP